MTGRARLCPPLTAVLLLFGCGESDSGWYRADAGPYEFDYVIYRAGLDDGSCMVIYVSDSPPDGGDAQLVDVEVAHPTRDLGVWAREFDGGADRCGTRAMIWSGFVPGSTPITQASGSLRFVESLDEDGDPRVCAVDLDGRFAGRPVDARVPLHGYWGFLCPTPSADTFEVDVLGASSPDSRDDHLALRAWNPAEKVCYGLDFFLDEYSSTVDPDEALDLPQSWRLVGADMVVFVSEEECAQGSFPPPTEENGYERLRILGDVETARGRLVFDESQPWINPLDDTPTPCEISVDIRVDFVPHLHWTPTSVRFVDDHVRVAQTCGQ